MPTLIILKGGENKMTLRCGINNNNIFREPYNARGKVFTVTEVNIDAVGNRDHAHKYVQVRDSENFVHSLMFDSKEDAVSFARWIEYAFGRDVPQPEWMVYQAMEQQGLVPADKTA